MKRLCIPGIVDIVLCADAAEIKVFADDLKLDRAYADHSILVNSKILQRVRSVLQVDGRPLPTVAPRCAEGRAAAQEALWKRLSSLATGYAAGPIELEDLAEFVRGTRPDDTCGPLVQKVVGQLFAPAFKATIETWNAALVLDKATRTLNLPLLAWWKLIGRIERARGHLSEMVNGDPAAVHAVGIAVHNIVNGVNLMRELYSDSSNHTALSPEMAGSRCIFAPASVLRQPTNTDDSVSGALKTGTLLMLKLQSANIKTADADLIFLRNTWSQCPAERWVPALLQGIWRRARGHPLPNGT